MDRNVTAFEPVGRCLSPTTTLSFSIGRYLAMPKGTLTSVGRCILRLIPLFAGELKTLCMESGFDEVNIIRDSYGKLRFIQAGRIIRK